VDAGHEFANVDGMIKSGKIREMIIVAPNGWYAYGGGFYTNSSVTGNWEDYMFKDLVQNIDANFRTIRKPEWCSFSPPWRTTETSPAIYRWDR